MTTCASTYTLRYSRVFRWSVQPPTVLIIGGACNGASRLAAVRREASPLGVIGPYGGCASRPAANPSAPACALGHLPLAGEVWTQFFPFPQLFPTVDYFLWIQLFPKLPCGLTHFFPQGLWSRFVRPFRAFPDFSTQRFPTTVTTKNIYPFSLRKLCVKEDFDEVYL